MSIKFTTLRTIVLLLSLLVALVSSDCIYLHNCEEAMKYVNLRSSDSETVQILRKNHCGYGIHGAKTHCDQIPKFIEPPEDCVQFYNCPAAVNLIVTRKFDPKVIALLKSSSCGYSARKDYVLCNQITAISKYEKKLLLPKISECGNQNPFDKIAGGKLTELDDFPWLALLQYKNSTNHLNYGCHGSLINEKYIVTAAHCINMTSNEMKQIGKLYKIILGEYDLRSSIDCVLDDCVNAVQEFSIESVHCHPNFLSNEHGFNDIGLIRINGVANLSSSFVRPICLPLNGTIIEQGQKFIIAGWGKTENNLQSPIKLKAVINYIPDGECSKWERFLIPDSTQICAGSSNRQDTCRGDSGGPLMLQNNYQDTFKTILMGIVSIGRSCGSTAALYTNISLYIDWILENMEP